MDDEWLSRLIAVTGPAGTGNDALAAAVAAVRNAPARARSSWWKG